MESGPTANDTFLGVEHLSSAWAIVYLANYMKVTKAIFSKAFDYT